MKTPGICIGVILTAVVTMQSLHEKANDVIRVVMAARYPSVIANNECDFIRKLRYRLRYEEKKGTCSFCIPADTSYYISFLQSITSFPFFDIDITASVCMYKNYSLNRKVSELSELSELGMKCIENDIKKVLQTKNQDRVPSHRIYMHKSIRKPLMSISGIGFVTLIKNHEAFDVEIALTSSLCIYVLARAIESSWKCWCTQSFELQNIKEIRVFKKIDRRNDDKIKLNAFLLASNNLIRSDI